MRTARLLLPFLLALVVTGCAGRTSPDRPDESATLLLDFRANGVHAGIFSAVRRGYDSAEGVRLRVREPAAGTDGVRALLSGRAAFAVLDIHDLALAREKGRDVVGVMALVQRPLAAVIARADTRTPRALEGQRVGVTGLPSDEAVLRSVVRGAGGDPARVRTTRIGFTAVPALLAGRVRAATAFWSVEGAALKAERPRAFREFRVDDFGAPAYPELVLCVARSTLQDKPATVRAAVAAIRRGYEFTLDDPESSAADVLARTDGLERADVLAQVDGLTDAFVGRSGHPGTLDLPILRRWARWEARFGITRRPPDIGRMFDPAG